MWFQGIDVHLQIRPNGILFPAGYLNPPPLIRGKKKTIKARALIIKSKSWKVALLIYIVYIDMKQNDTLGEKHS